MNFIALMAMQKCTLFFGLCGIGCIDQDASLQFLSSHEFTLYVITKTKTK